MISLKKKFLILICIILLTITGLMGCSKAKEPISKSGFYFDTVIMITLYDKAYEEYLDGCLQLAGTYENLFSATKEGSDISKLNAAKGETVTLNPETIVLLKKGIYYSNVSNGGFDITLGALSSLWNFGHNEGTVPSKEAIATAVSSIGYQGIKIEGNDVTLSNPDTRIDLGAIAKGYIADRMKEYLNKKGVTSGLINLGGNVLSVGPKENGEPYTIGIQKPFEKEGTALGAVSITEETVVSSGTYERNFTTDGVFYHHLLNPKTGYPYENDLTGVTIICKNSVDGDGLSTTCFSLGLEEGMKLIEDLEDTEAIFITKDNKLHFSSGMKKTIPFELINP